MNSPHKISHCTCKSAPIFTTLAHNTYLDSLDMHTCCDLQKVARTRRIKKMWRLSDLLELLYETSTSSKLHV